ncbi:alanine racemase [Amycolatopsis sp. OK19-0408]|uniref:Alanine racemase n=1 Tax=Amycolatopsis iheyensis TaxID=2945988 RepID=A0A9X2SIK4_9PSEU|nr:alanine racemase [Amycolatopsis iheyensis]MCR6483504.1 alanine racemase [Amycolatopsis iheyensis]
MSEAWPGRRITTSPPVREALHRVGTPAYVYDVAEVRRNARRLRSALPRQSSLYYSLKANPHPALLGTLREGGAKPEVCSPGELDAALEAGWPAADVLYTGPGKRDVDLTSALRLGVRTFSVDSPSALDQLDKLAANLGVRARCLLRVNDDQPTPGQRLTMTGVPSQFGADTAWVLAEPERFTGGPNAPVVGLHLYMGTNLVRVDDLFAQFGHALRTATRTIAALAAEGARIEVLDLGGGFGAPFARAGAAVAFDGLRERLEELFDDEVPGWRAGRPAIAFESGRYLVGTAGTLVTAVLDAKRSHGREIVVLESGINHLGGMSGLRRVPPLLPELLAVGRAPDPAEATETTVVGPLCTPLDTWAHRAPLPKLVPGDLLAVPNTGAYGLHASLLAFLGHPAPAEVVVDGELPGSPVVHASRLHLTRAPIHGAPGKE